VTGRRLAWLALAVGAIGLISTAWVIMTGDAHVRSGDSPVPPRSASAQETCLSTIEGWTDAMVRDQVAYYQVNQVLDGIGVQRRDAGDGDGMRATLAAREAANHLLGLTVTAANTGRDTSAEYEDTLGLTRQACADPTLQEVVADARIDLGF
jgi:hypothetical protein